MKNRNQTFALLVASVVALGLLACKGVPSAVGADEPPAAGKQLEGKAAPDFTLDTIDGKNTKLSDLKGNVVVLDFWATWCPPCRLSLPHLQKLSQDKELGEKGLKVLAMNQAEEKDVVDEFLKKNSYSFSVVMDKEQAAAKVYMVQGIPTTVVIGRDGNVKAYFEGFDPDKSPKELDEAVEAAIKEAKAAK